MNFEGSQAEEAIIGLEAPPMQPKPQKPPNRSDKSNKSNNERPVTLSEKNLSQKPHKRRLGDERLRYELLKARGKTNTNPKQMSKISTRSVPSFKVGSIKSSAASKKSPPSQPTPISNAVASKVRAVQTWVSNRTLRNSSLDRASDNQVLATVPESALLAAIITMQTRYEVSLQSDSGLSDVEEAISARFQKCLGDNLLDFVTVDFDKTTKLETDIKTKIGHCGLDGINLLEVELEVNKIGLLKQLGLSTDLCEPTLSR